MPRANGITRQEILSSIKTRGSMTADELSRELGISQVAVRQHLSSLEAENIVSVIVERRGLGRPAHRYMLTPRGDENFPRSYDVFANGLLDDLETWLGRDAVFSLLERRRERMGSQFSRRLQDRPLPRRLEELASVLSEQGFMAETHPGTDDSYTLIKRNCAIYNIACNHPHVCCRGDVDLYQRILGDVSVEPKETIAEGANACTFRISPNHAQAAVRADLLNTPQTAEVNPTV